MTDYEKGVTDGFREAALTDQKSPLAILDDWLAYWTPDFEFKSEYVAGFLAGASEERRQCL